MSSNAVVFRDKNSNLILESLDEPSGLVQSDIIPSDIVRLVIDPSKGYMPVQSGIYKSDGSPITEYRCTDFREVNEGIWIPFSFVEQSSGAMSCIGPYYFVCTVEKCMINQAITDEDFAFDFPQGTLVHDQLAGLDYLIGQQNSSSQTPSENTVGLERRTPPAKLLMAATHNGLELVQIAPLVFAKATIKSCWPTLLVVLIVLVAVAIALARLCRWAFRPHVEANPDDLPPVASSKTHP